MIWFALEFQFYAAIELLIKHPREPLAVLRRLHIKSLFQHVENFKLGFSNLQPLKILVNLIENSNEYFSAIFNIRKLKFGLIFTNYQHQHDIEYLFPIG
jgi:hypothetical protein